MLHPVQPVSRVTLFLPIVTPLFLYLIDSCLSKSDPNSTPLCCNSTSMFTSNLLIIVLIRLKTRQARAFSCRRASPSSNIFRREHRVVTEAGCLANESFADSYFANVFGKIVDCRWYVLRNTSRLTCPRCNARLFCGNDANSISLPSLPAGSQRPK